MMVDPELGADAVGGNGGRARSKDDERPRFGLRRSPEGGETISAGRGGVGVVDSFISPGEEDSGPSASVVRAGDGDGIMPPPSARIREAMTSPFPVGAVAVAGGNADMGEAG